MANARLPRLSVYTATIPSREGSFARTREEEDGIVACIDVDSLAQYERDAR